MTSRSPERRARVFARPARPGNLPIDRMASDILDLLIRAFRLADYDMEHFLKTVREHCARISHDVRPLGHGTRIDLDEGADILTYWSIDSQYTDSKGKPLPLPAFGPPPSIESLSKLAKLTAPIEETIANLESAGTIGKRGRKYVFRKREVIHLRPENLTARQLKTLYFLLLNFVHNQLAKKPSERLFERSAESAPISISASRAFSARLRRKKGPAMAFLEQRDAELADLSADWRLGRAGVKEVVTIFHTRIPVPANKHNEGRRRAARHTP